MFQHETKKARLPDPLPARKPQPKNEPCLQFQRGSCNYGDRCCFTHGISDLTTFNKHQQQQLVPVYDNNRNPRCTEKTRLCWRFMSGEKCQYGDKCHFIHVRPDDMSVDENGEMKMMRKVFPWRTKLCIRWMNTGSCKYGGYCCYAHGVSELKNQGVLGAQGHGEGGVFKLVDKKVEGKQLKIKWKNNEKISGVYADWINDMPLVFPTI